MDEEDDGTPLWKKALMKKRAAEQKKKEQVHQKKVAFSHQNEYLYIAAPNRTLLQG